MRAAERFGKGPARAPAARAVPDYLTHYYRSDTGPFRSLSSLADAEALRVMRALCDDTPYGARFKDPEGYLHARRETERWVRAEFVERGGAPLDPFPTSAVLGSSRWLVAAAPAADGHAEVRIPLSVLSERDVSFTYPDSMLSRWLALVRPPDLYRADLHGRVFTLPEILALVGDRGMPEDAWATNAPPDFAPYIEAQVWNRALLEAYVAGAAP